MTTRKDGGEERRRTLQGGGRLLRDDPDIAERGGRLLLEAEPQNDKDTGDKSEADKKKDD